MSEILFDPNDFDPMDPALAAQDPTADHKTERFWAVMRDFQETCPVAHSDTHGGFWTVTRHEDIIQIARDWETFSTVDGIAIVPFDVGDSGFRLLPFEADPPYHTSLRKLVNPYLLPTAVAKHEDAARAIANQLIDAFIDRGACSFMEEFAAPFPARVFFEEFLGLSADAIGGAFNSVQRLVMNPGAPLEPIMELVPWCQNVLAMRQEEERRDDVLDALVHGLVDGERPLTDTERIQMLITLLIGGLETTSAGIGNIVLHLATNEGLHRSLLDGADLAQACEEFLRFLAPVPAIARTATRDVEFNGCPMKKGDRVLLYYGAANRDPKAWEEPDRLDVTREEARKQLAFGNGIHYCLGAYLARLELRVALGEILRRLSDIRLDPVDVDLVWRTGQTRGPLELPISFRSRTDQ